MDRGGSARRRGGDGRSAEVPLCTYPPPTLKPPTRPNQELSTMNPSASSHGHQPYTIYRLPPPMNNQPPNARQSYMVTNQSKDKDLDRQAPPLRSAAHMARLAIVVYVVVSISMPIETYMYINDMPIGYSYPLKQTCRPWRHLHFPSPTACKSPSGPCLRCSAYVDVHK